MPRDERDGCLFDHKIVAEVITLPELAKAGTRPVYLVESDKSMNRSRTGFDCVHRAIAVIECDIPAISVLRYRGRAICLRCEDRVSSRPRPDQPSMGSGVAGLATRKSPLASRS